MSIRKDQAMDMYINKISWYGTYVECLSRVINEFIENGGSNMNKNDIPNLTELLAKFSKRLNRNILNMKSDWEFMD